MTAITDGTDTVHPILWMDYATARTSNTLVHPLVSGSTAITMAPAGSRTMKLALLFSDETEAKKCEEMHARPAIFTITEDGLPTRSMQYVVTGQITRELDPETATVWIVSVQTQEVGAQ